jgi:hypothetical protein
VRWVGTACTARTRARWRAREWRRTANGRHEGQERRSHRAGAAAGGGAGKHRPAVYQTRVALPLLFGFPRKGARQGSILWVGSPSCLRPGSLRADGCSYGARAAVTGRPRPAAWRVPCRDRGGGWRSASSRRRGVRGPTQPDQGQLCVFGQLSGAMNNQGQLFQHQDQTDQTSHR